MELLYLIKPGELTLKGGNRKEFENRLKVNIKRQLSGLNRSVIQRGGRFYVNADCEPAEIEPPLSQVPGIAGFARAVAADRSMEALEKAAVEEIGKVLADNRGTRFKVETRREFKQFPLDSYGVSGRVGEVLLDAYPQLTVDVHNPDWVLFVEVRDRIYLYARSIQGERGLPTYSSGRGLLLLSGGIDSPVAGYMMAKRGLKLEAVYFHAYPYTSNEAKQKVIDLARIVGRYCLGMKLHIVSFTDAQMRIKERARPDETTLLMRACMMKIADSLAMKTEASCLITGESLGQVASQTAENIRFTGSYASLPVFRPLIGTDKEDITRTAVKIGSYETSILPYEDCCVLFSPKHPVLKADFRLEKEHYDALDIQSLLDEALAGKETVPGNT